MSACWRTWHFINERRSNHPDRFGSQEETGNEHLVGYPCSNFLCAENLRPHLRIELVKQQVGRKIVSPVSLSYTKHRSNQSIRALKPLQPAFYPQLTVSLTLTIAVTQWHLFIYHILVHVASYRPIQRCEIIKWLTQIYFHKGDRTLHQIPLLSVVLLVVLHLLTDVHNSCL